MTGEQSRKLQTGARVHWMGDEKDAGTVIENTWSGVFIKWDNRGEQSIMHNDMDKVSARH
jgi:hypothetical protein